MSDEIKTRIIMSWLLRLSIHLGQILIGASLSEPHTSMTAPHTSMTAFVEVVCMYACLVVAIYCKFK